MNARRRGGRATVRTRKRAGPAPEGLEDRTLLASGEFHFPAGSTSYDLGQMAAEHARVAEVVIDASPTDPMRVVIDPGPYAIDNSLKDETANAWLFGDANGDSVANRDGHCDPFTLSQRTTLGLYNGTLWASLHLRWGSAKLPGIWVEATDPDAAESGPGPANPGTFRLTRDGGTDFAQTFYYAVTGTATAGADYLALSGYVDFAPGETTKDVDVFVADDSLAEGPETVVLTIQPSSDYVVYNDRATVTIADFVPLPTLSVAATDANAAEAGLDPGTFTVTRTGDTSRALAFHYTVTGTATAGSDYIGLPGDSEIPAGAASGTITVTPMADALAEGDETVVLTLQPESSYEVVSPGTATVTIADANLPRVQIALNGTTDQADDITLYNPPGSPQPYAQPIAAVVTNTGPAGTVALSVLPPGAGTLDVASFAMATGESRTVTFTPAANSTKANDVQVVATSLGTRVGAEDLTLVRVDLPTNVRRSNTPDRMPDRIPPTRATYFDVTVTPPLGSAFQSVTLYVRAADVLAGHVAIDGASEAVLTTGRLLGLAGDAQTTPGHAGGLALVAQVRDVDTIASAPFSVAAIPVNLRETKREQRPNGVLYFEYAWQSDSGALSDLDEVWLGEHVTYSDGGKHTGKGRPWHGPNNPDPTIAPDAGRDVRNRPSGPRSGTAGVAKDEHSPPSGGVAAGPKDMYVAIQNYGFHDFRTDNRADDGTLGWRLPLYPEMDIIRAVVNLGSTKKPDWEYWIVKYDPIAGEFKNTAKLPLIPGKMKQAAAAAAPVLAPADRFVILPDVPPPASPFAMRPRPARHAPTRPSDLLALAPR